MTRFSRKPIEGERLIEAAARGARVWSYPGEYDLTTADGRAAFRDAVNKAAAESDKPSERAKWGKHRRAEGARPWRGRGYAIVGRRHPDSARDDQAGILEPRAWRVPSTGDHSSERDHVGWHSDRCDSGIEGSAGWLARACCSGSHRPMYYLSVSTAGEAASRT